MRLADRLVAAKDRYPLYPIDLEDSGDFIERGVLAHRDHLLGHEIGNVFSMRLDELRRERRRGGHTLQPPWTLIGGIDFVTSQEVSFADDAHHAAFSIDDR